MDARDAKRDADGRRGLANHLVDHPGALHVLGIAVTESEQGRESASVPERGDHAVLHQHHRRLVRGEKPSRLRQNILIAHRLHLPVYFKPLHRHRRQRPRRAQMLACTATDAFHPVDRRHLRRRGVILDRGHHIDRMHGAVTRTGVAGHSLGRRQTAVLIPDRIPSVDVALARRRHWADRPRGTHLATRRALGATVAVFKAHLRLQGALGVP